MCITTDLSRFGARARGLLVDLLTSWNERGLPEDFSDDEVVPVMNTRSGCVFLTNDIGQVCMMKGDSLESFYYTPYHGHEGFKEDLTTQFRNDTAEDKTAWHDDDVEYLHDIGGLSNEEYEEFINLQEEISEDL